MSTSSKKQQSSTQASVPKNPGQPKPVAAKAPPATPKNKGNEAASKGKDNNTFAPLAATDASAVEDDDASQQEAVAPDSDTPLTDNELTIEKATKLLEELREQQRKTQAQIDELGKFMLAHQPTTMTQKTTPPTPNSTTDRPERDQKGELAFFKMIQGTARSIPVFSKITMADIADHWDIIEQHFHAMGLLLNAPKDRLRVLGLYLARTDQPGPIKNWWNSYKATDPQFKKRLAMGEGTEVDYDEMRVAAIGLGASNGMTPNEAGERVHQEGYPLNPRKTAQENVTDYVRLVREWQLLSGRRVEIELQHELLFQHIYKNREFFGRLALLYATPGKRAYDPTDSKFMVAMGQCHQEIYLKEGSAKHGKDEKKDNKANNNAANNDGNAKKNNNNKGGQQGGKQGPKADICTLHPTQRHTNEQCFQQHPERRAGAKVAAPTAATNSTTPAAAPASKPAAARPPTPTKN